MKNVTDLHVWTGSDCTRRGCPDGVGQNGQVGEGEHGSQEHVLLAAVAALPG